MKTSWLEHSDGPPEPGADAADGVVGVPRPLQIVVAAWMAAIASDHSRGHGPMWVEAPKTRKHLTAFATVYALLMLLRFVVTVAIAPHSVVNRGLIPILAHWDLAAFVALLARAPASPGGGA